MEISLHHAHLFASDLDASIRFYREMFGAEVILDATMAGARNVMISIGSSKINFYDQPPRDQGCGAVHHLGIETDDLEGLVERMTAEGQQFRNPIKDLGFWKYVMAEGPDGVLLELFEVSEQVRQGEQTARISSL